MHVALRMAAWHMASGWDGGLQQGPHAHGMGARIVSSLGFGPVGLAVCRLGGRHGGAFGPLGSTILGCRVTPWPMAVPVRLASWQACCPLGFAF